MYIIYMHVSPVLNLGTPDYVTCCVFSSALGNIDPPPMAQQPLVRQVLLIIEAL
jgi:hypothetical protein